MECLKEQNKKDCGCTYGCPTSGMCCACVRHHRENGEIPGCFFPRDFEKTYDRSIENFLKAYGK